MGVPYVNKVLCALRRVLEESDRTWAIQYLLSRFAKSGGVLGNFTLIINL
ncbi:hypothetical protein LC612_34915 [Nostoc sp. CHAB 5834]|nr:hypothetical protein [Nostoc sp. CHAB 5834]